MFELFFTVIKHTNITTSINKFYWMSKLLLSYQSYLAGLMTILFTWVTYVQNSLLFMETLIQRTTIEQCFATMISLLCGDQTVETFNLNKIRIFDQPFCGQTSWMLAIAKNYRNGLG